MRLKLYRAPAMAEAMRQVRADLGDEALILSTRRVSDGVEVTAGLDVADEPVQPSPARPLPTSRAPAAPPAVPPEPPSRPAFRAEPAPPAAAPSAQMVALAFHGASASVQRKLQAGALPFALSVAFRFAKLPVAPGEPPLLLVGPPGAGKTLSIVRLATRMVMAGTRPLVITADGQRAGATEQLAAFTRLLGINLLVASQPAAMRRALARREEGAPVLIDAPGTDPFVPAQRETIAALAASADAAMALVLPAGMDPAEAGDVAAGFAEQGASLLVATRLDVARRMGSILAAAEAGLTLVEAGIGPGAADGMVPLTPELLAQRLLQLPSRPASSVSEIRA